MQLRRVQAIYTLGGLPGYGAVAYKLSERIFSRSNPSDSLDPEWVTMPLDSTTGGLDDFLPVTKDPDVATSSGRTPYLLIRERVGGTPHGYSIEVEAGDDALDLIAQPHLLDGSDNYSITDIDADAPIRPIKRGRFVYLAIDDTEAPTGVPLNYFVLNKKGFIVGAEYVDYALASALLAEQTSRVQNDSTLQAMITLLGDPTTGYIAILRTDLTAEIDRAVAAEAATNAALTAETANRTSSDTALGSRVTATEAAISGLSGVEPNRLDDTYGGLFAPGVDYGGRTRWYTPSNLTQDTDPSHSPFAEPSLILGTGAADGGRYLYLDEHGLLTTDALSFSSSVKAASGSYRLGVIWYNNAGAQGAATYGPAQTMDGTVKRLVLENQVPTDGTTVKAAVFVHRASGATTLAVYDITAKKSATASATPLPSFVPNLFSEVVQARGTLLSLDARLDVTLDEDGLPRPTDAYLKGLITSDGWELSGSGVYVDDDFDHGNIRYPRDGATGVVQVDSRNADSGIVEGAHWTYVRAPYSKTITRPTSGWVYDDDGNLLAQPALTVS